MSNNNIVLENKRKIVGYKIIRIIALMFFDNYIGTNIYRKLYVYRYSSNGKICVYLLGIANFEIKTILTT